MASDIATIGPCEFELICAALGVAVIAVNFSSIAAIWSWINSIEQRCLVLRIFGSRTLYISIYIYRFDTYANHNVY